MPAQPRTVLVTGTSTGIGRATVELLAQHGFHVFAGVRTLDAADPPAPEGVERLQLDVANVDHVAAVVERLREACPAGLYALVNNAGMAAPNPAELIDLDELRLLVETNAVAPLQLIQACLPLLRPARGRIVNVTSMNGTISLPMVGAYSASKFALEAICDALRVELRPWGITVTAVRPGQVRTAIFDKALAALDERSAAIPDELAPGYAKLYKRAKWFAQHGAKSGSSPEAVAAAILNALTARRPRARYVVGLDARILGMMQAALPTRMYDWLLARMLGANDRT